MGVKKITVRIHRPRSGRFVLVPAGLPRFSARIEHPAAGSKVLQNEEIRKKNHRSRCRRMLRRENSGPCFAKKKHRFHCRPVLRRKKKGQTGADVLSKVEKRSKIGNRRSIRLLRKVNSAPRFRYPIRKKKPSFSLQTGARRRNSGANGPRRRAKVFFEVGR